MKGHLPRCRCASGAHVRHSTLRASSRGALHLTFPEQAQRSVDLNKFSEKHVLLKASKDVS